MKGPTPKDQSIRQRRNKSASRAVLVADSMVRQRAPRLPKREGGWQEMTRRWWRSIWASPLAQEYLDVDIHALLTLAVLIDLFWTEPSKALASEIRLQQQAFGLTPLDRRRLEWQVIQTEEALDKREIKRGKRAKTVSDPRGVLE